MRFSLAHLAITTALVPAALAAPVATELAPQLDSRSADPAGGIIHISKNHDSTTRISSHPPRALQARALPLPIKAPISESSQVTLLKAWDDLNVPTDAPLDVKSKAAGGSDKEDQVLQSLTGSDDDDVKKLFEPKGPVDAAKNEVEEIKLKALTGNGVEGSVYYKPT